MPNFTPEDLLLYDAGELDAETRQLVEKELLVNWTLREKLAVLKEGFASLNQVQLSAPRKQTVKNIMLYALEKTVTV